MEHESDKYANCDWCSSYSDRRMIKGTRGLEERSGNHQNYCIIKIGQNSEKSPGDMRHAVTQTPMKNQPLMLMGKIQGVKNNNNNKENPKRETESLPITVQNNGITSMWKQRWTRCSKCRLRDKKHEIINHILSECSKLAQWDYKTRYDCEG